MAEGNGNGARESGVLKAIHDKLDNAIRREWDYHRVEGKVQQLEAQLLVFMDRKRWRAVEHLVLLVVLPIVLLIMLCFCSILFAMIWLIR